MADKSYDVVLIGGGVKSMTTALYLAKYGGMSVGVFEERRELCSGATSMDAVVPGFTSDHHATSISLWYYMPLREDFPDFEDRGGKIVQAPVGQTGIAIEDQKCWMVYTRDEDPNGEKTAKTILEFSNQHDADTYMKLFELTKPGTDFYTAMVQYWFNPPGKLDDPPSPMEIWLKDYLKSPDCLIDASWMSLPAINALQRLWDRPAMAYTYLRQLSVGGRLVHMAPAGIDQLTRIAITPEVGFLQGGTHSLAHAYQRLFYENGGEWYPRKKVDSVIVENGAAKGIRLTDGTQIKANKLVISSVDPYQLFHSLIPKEYVDPKILKKVDSLVGNMVGLCWYGWYMHEPPKWKAAEHNPDIEKSSYVILASDNIKLLSDVEHYLGMGKIPPQEGQMFIYNYHTADATRAPAGKYSCMEDSKVPSFRYFTEREWLKIKKDHAEAALKEWQRYAPNMTWDNIIGFDPQTPYDVAGRGLNFARDGNPGILDVYPGQTGRTAPMVELAQFRTPIKNLYATGAWHSPTGANCGTGYACYKIIAEDLGLRKPWEEKNRPF